MHNVSLLVDWKCEKDFFLPGHLEDAGFDVTVFGIDNFNLKDRLYKFRYPLLLIKFMALALKALIRTKSDDVIVCWNYTVGFCCCLLRMLFFKKHTIICLNLIAHGRTGLLNIMRKALFKSILTRENIFITINSNQLIDQYHNEFGISIDKMFVLEDPVMSKYSVKDFKQKDTYIFCGGEAKRDWKTLFDSCRMLPSYKFICVARKRYFSDNFELPPNVKMYFDTEVNTFYELLENASIQVLPLESIRPAGLIVLIRGALLSIPAIVSRTPAVENYVQDGVSGTLINIGDHVSLSNAIKRLYDDYQLQEKYACNLRKSILQNYGEDAYTLKLCQIIEKCCADKRC